MHLFDRGEARGLWFFLSVVVVSRMAFEFYKLRLSQRSSDFESEKIRVLESEIAQVRLNRSDLERRLAALEESVFFGDYELKKQFRDVAKKVSI